MSGENQVTSFPTVNVTKTFANRSTMWMEYEIVQEKATHDGKMTASRGRHVVRHPKKKVNAESWVKSRDK